MAKYLIQEKKVNATLDAVISAIRRYHLGNYEQIFENAQEMIKQTSAISSKSPLANISLTKDPDVQGVIPQLFTIIYYNRGDVLRIIQADESIKVVVDEKNLKKVLDLFPGKKILRIEPNLGEINVHFPSESRYTPGILALASNELAINGINITDTLSCFPEWLWFVDEKDIQKAYNVLYRLLATKSKNPLRVPAGH